MARATLIVFLLTFSASVYGLDEESAKERKCFEIKSTMPIDTKWITSLKEIYYPVMSRLDLYRTAADLTHRDFKDITEDELYYKSCIKFSFAPDGSFLATGFNGANAKFSMRPKDAGLEIIEFGEETGLHGTCYTTLTDNKTFVFFACCSNGDEMHWGAISTEKKLPKKTVRKIHEHAESLGFGKEQFTGLRYTSCDKKKVKKQEL